jgi:hypothetical protein
MSLTLQQAPNANIEKVRSLAKNLNTEFPRSPRNTEVGGYLLLARAVDKLRGILVGQDGTDNTYGSYHYNCPLDKMLFGHFGIDAQGLHDVIASGASDAEVGEWFTQNANLGSMEAKVQFNNQMRYRNIAEMPIALQMYLEGEIAKRIPAEKQVNIRYFLDVIDTKEGRL